MDALLKDYVGDKVDFVTKDGFAQKKLYFKKEVGLYVIHNNEVTPVTHWKNDAVVSRVRTK